MKTEQTATGWVVVSGGREVSAERVGARDLVRVKKLIRSGQWGEALQVLAVWADQLIHQIG